MLFPILLEKKSRYVGWLLITSLQSRFITFAISPLFLQYLYPYKAKEKQGFISVSNVFLRFIRYSPTKENILWNYFHIPRFTLDFYLVHWNYFSSQNTTTATRMFEDCWKQLMKLTTSFNKIPQLDCFVKFCLLSKSIEGTASITMERTSPFLNLTDEKKE